MSTEEAAAYLKLSERTLQSYRGSGKGPPFSRFGNRARYLRSKVAAWGREREAHSTAEADEKARQAGKNDREVGKKARGKSAAVTPRARGAGPSRCAGAPSTRRSGAAPSPTGRRRP